jgi:fumarate reductase (CoM/CoB) subunit A
MIPLSLIRRNTPEKDQTTGLVLDKSHYPWLESQESFNLTSLIEGRRRKEGETEMLPPKMTSVDVLVIGGGIAGLAAAVHALRQGTKVAILVKGETCSTGIVGFNVAFRQSPAGDSPAQFFNDLMVAGGFLNDERLVAAMAYESELVLKELLEMGVHFQEADGRLAVRQAAGSSFPRTVYYGDLIGPQIMGQMTQTLTTAGAEIYRGTTALSLLKSKDGIIGALAIQGDHLLSISAKATILAAGGAGNMYAFTTNPSSLAGEGYRMAFEAGAPLMDMEFVQFEPFIFVHPPNLKGWSTPTTSVWDGARVYNREGQEFLPKDKNGKVKPLTKDVLSRLIFFEIAAGRGTEHGGVYMDWSVLPPEVISKYPRFVKTAQNGGVDPYKTPMEIAPAHHHMMGGVIIDSFCQTAIPGLLAAGEVAAGVHAANRLAGAAGTDVLVFGRRAGNAAATYCRGIRVSQKGAAEAVSSVLKRLSRRMGKETYGKENAAGILSELQETMWQNIGIVREAGSMEKAAEKIAHLQKKARQLKALTIRDLIPMLEVESACFTASLIARAALLREESRGDHYRKDFPQRDDVNWLKHIVFQRSRGEEPKINWVERRWKKI